MSTIDAADLEHVLAATEPLWSEMHGQRIFITGGTGFFGTWLLESFSYANRKLDLRAKATVLSRNPEAFRKRTPHLAADPAICFLCGDVRDFAWPVGEFLYVIHAATDASAWLTRNRPREMLSTIVQGTQRVLAFAEAAGSQKLLIVSSGAVYGSQPWEVKRLDEAWTGAPDPVHPSSVYGEGKRFAELLCSLSATERLQVKIARCFAFVGPHLPLDSHFAAGNFLADVLAGRSISIHGDGTSVRSYLYAADLAIWLWTILFQGQSLRPYNVGSEEAVTMQELAQATVNAAAQALEVQTLALDRSTPTRYVPSTARATQELGLKQTIELEDALRRTITWHRLKSHETSH